MLVLVCVGVGVSRATLPPLLPVCTFLTPSVCTFKTVYRHYASKCYRSFFSFGCFFVFFVLRRSKGGRAPPFECVSWLRLKEEVPFSSAVSQWEGNTEIGFGACFSTVRQSDLRW